MQPTNCFAVLEGVRKPRLVEAGVITTAKTAAIAEDRLRELIGAWTPTLIAVDAPLTLPPCLTCPAVARDRERSGASFTLLD